MPMLRLLQSLTTALVGATSTFDADGISAAAGVAASVVLHPANKTIINTAVEKVIFLSVLFIIEPPKLIIAAIGIGN